MIALVQNLVNSIIRSMRPYGCLYICSYLLTLSHLSFWCSLPSLNLYRTIVLTRDLGQKIKNKKQGPVVQSVVSLTSSLRVISLTIFWYFLLKKMCVAFALKFQHICVSLGVNFNESLTNNVVSFEQLGPEWQTVWIPIRLLNRKHLIWIYIFYKYIGFDL